MFFSTQDQLATEGHLNTLLETSGPSPGPQATLWERAGMAARESFRDRTLWEQRRRLDGEFQSQIKLARDMGASLEDPTHFQDLQSAPIGILASAFAPGLFPEETFRRWDQSVADLQKKYPQAGFKTYGQIQADLQARTHAEEIQELDAAERRPGFLGGAAWFVGGAVGDPLTWLLAPVGIEAKGLGLLREAVRQGGIQMLTEAPIQFSRLAAKGELQGYGQDVSFQQALLNTGLAIPFGAAGHLGFTGLGKALGATGRLLARHPKIAAILAKPGAPEGAIREVLGSLNDGEVLDVYKTIHEGPDPVRLSTPEERMAAAQVENQQAVLSQNPSPERTLETDAAHLEKYRTARQTLEAGHALDENFTPQRIDPTAELTPSFRAPVEPKAIEPLHEARIAEFRHVLASLPDDQAVVVPAGRREGKVVSAKELRQTFEEDDGLLKAIKECAGL